MENQKQPGIAIKKANLEYFQKLQQFIADGRKDSDFCIMYKTYQGVDPDSKVIQNYQAQKQNKEQYEEDESSYDDSYNDNDDY